MWKTVLFLIFTLVVVPILAFNFDEPLSIAQESALQQVGAIYLIMALLAFVVSTISKNYSQVDKLWSTIPIVYVWVVFAASNFEFRIGLMALLVTAWAIRLTYNFNRRGGYSWRFWEGEEDYRWAVLRAKPEFQAGWKWMLFNFFFISLYQMGLVLMMTLPIVKSMGAGPLTWIDIVLALIILGLIVMEAIADQQQYSYQEEKHRRIREGEALGAYYGKGFTHTGLWAHMRHPNYTAEQSIWIVFYLFSVLATGTWINWSIAGCLLLVLLFKGSSDFSEGISKAKYPDYQQYIEQVPRFIPWFGKKYDGKTEATPETVVAGE